MEFIFCVEGMEGGGERGREGGREKGSEFLRKRQDGACLWTRGRE